MKTYKTWEVIKMLSENPKLKFKKHSPGNSIVLGAQVIGFSSFLKLCRTDFTDKTLNNNIRLDEEWTLIQEPVDFMTAVRSGKKIKVEHILASHLDITKKYLTLKNLLDTLCYSYPSDAICDILTEGKFYIEEQEGEDE